MRLMYENIIEKLTSNYYMTEATFNDFCNILERINMFMKYYPFILQILF